MWWIGTVSLGRVDAVDGEAVATKFLMVGMPIIPLSSHYFTTPMGIGTVVFGGSSFAIRTNAKSVFAGYARMYIFWVAIVLLAFLYDNSELDRNEMMVVGPVWLLWFLSLFVLGRVSSKEKLRRRLLRAATGVGVRAKWLLDPNRVLTVRRQLEQRWTSQTGTSDWRASLSHGARSGTEALLYSLCEYSGEHQLGQQALALAMNSPHECNKAPKARDTCRRCAASVSWFGTYPGGLCAACHSRERAAPPPSGRS